MTREQHLAWAKQRALEYVDAGEVDQAFASLMSDLNKHDGPWKSPAEGPIDESPAVVRAWIEGWS